VNSNVIPLAITMMAGPQIMSAIIFVTHPRAVRMSLAFITGAAIGVTLGVIVTRGLAALLGDNTSFGDSSDTGDLATIVQFVLVGLLIVGAIRNWVKRATIEPPKWLGALMEADERKAFTLGLLLLTIFPSDAMVLLTVGANLEQNGNTVWDAFPFIGLTVFIAASPLLAYLLFRRRAIEAMPKVRDWMNTHSWLVNIIVYVIFIVLILG
jgi:Sap, sulfolipid-1-addressing protein